MRFAVLGGDRRLAILSMLLLKDGHRVNTYSIEKAELPEEIPKAGCLQACIYGADCVILPVPAEKAGILYNPLSDEVLPMKDITSALWKGQILLGGKIGPETAASAVRAGLEVKDIMHNPGFVAGNAALTAEGALQKLIESGEKSLWKSKILITGWGRIGKLLALRLKAMGAELCIAARNAEDRAMIQALGMKAADYTELEGLMGGFDFIVNTVPERVVTEAMLCLAESGTVLMELASPPGGFDKNLAANIGIHVVLAPGLPGRTAAYTAALLMKKAVYEEIEGQEE